MSSDIMCIVYKMLNIRESPVFAYCWRLPDFLVIKRWGVWSMKIGPIIKAQQPDIHSQLEKKNNENGKRKGSAKEKEHSLSFYENLMQQDNFSRHNGAIKQKGWGGWLYVQRFNNVDA